MIEYAIGAVVALFVVFVYLRSDYAHYSIFTVGVFKRVSRRPNTTENECEESYCEHSVTDGETRIAYKEIVFCGVAIVRFGGVENHYCQDHTSLEFRQGEFAKPTVERLQESILSGFLSFSVFMQNSLDEDTEADPFNQATQATQNAFDLMGVAFIVLILAVMISAVKGVSLHD